jgi:16S rRNA processing protein RimM
MPKRKSFATRVKSSTRKAASRPGGAPRGGAPPGPPNYASPAAPATENLRQRELASHPDAVTAPPPPATKPRVAPTSNIQHPTSSPKRRHAPQPDAAPKAKPQAEPTPGYVAVGRVMAPFGLKGEMRVQTLTDNPDRFLPKSKLWAGDQPVTVLREREAQGFLYLTFKGYPDRDSVEKFRLALLQVPEDALPPLPEGEYYRFQLLGLTVTDRDGNVLGTLDEIIETGANDVYRVHPADGPDILVPALADVVLSVDLASRRMVVDPPEWR